MLYRSGENLFDSAIKFIDKSENVTLFSAYLKLEQLKKFNISKKINRIIVRWEVQDLCLKVSDIELYDYCRDNNIALYRNTRLHLKAFWDNNEDLVFGSANITGRGIGELGNYNFELNGSQNEISFDDILYLNKVIATSQYVCEDLYAKLKNIVDNTILPVLVYPELPTSKSEIDYFLISQLPMFTEIEHIYEAYSSTEELSIEKKNSLAHDIALFNIQNGWNKEGLESYLKNTFNNHVFILSLKQHIKSQPNSSLRYGGVVRWIQDNTTTVPTPRSWEMKKDQIVNTLYEWICFHDSDYSWDVPGDRSQVIYYKKGLY